MLERTTSQVHRRSLSDLADVTGGKRLPNGRTLQSSKTSHPYIRVADFATGNIYLKNIQYLPEDLGPLLRRYCVHAGDIILSVAGTLGVAAMVPPELDGANLTENADRISNYKGILPGFLLLCLQSDDTKASLIAEATQNAQPKLALERIRRLEIPVPPLEEQRKISAVLQTWDEAIMNLEALRTAKEAQLSALTRLLAFGGRRLAAFDKNSAMATHRWFSLPSDWAYVAIDEIAREISERHTGGEAYEVLSCSKYDGFVRSLEYFKKQVFSAKLDGYKKIWRDDFGFPSNHVEEGSIGLQNLVEVGLVSPIYTIFRFDPRKVFPEFAFAVLKTGLYRHIFEVSTSASVDRRGSLRWAEFSKIPFPLPSMPEQRAIVEVLLTGKHQIESLDEKIEAITRQKRGLMQKLLTGEWRVEV